MRANAFRKKFTGNREQDTLRTDIEQAVAGVLKGVITDGVLLTDVALVTGDNNIPHKLQRPVRGYIVVRRNVAVDIYDSITGQDENTRNIFLPLNASVDAVVSLWIF